MFRKQYETGASVVAHADRDPRAESMGDQLARYMDVGKRRSTPYRT
jgi:hypothetical protein